MKYRRRNPDTVEAVQWTGTDQSRKQVWSFLEAHGADNIRTNRNNSVQFNGSDDQWWVCVGDWVLWKTNTKRFDVHTDAEFRREFEEVTE